MKFKTLSAALGHYVCLLVERIDFHNRKYCDLVHALALSVGYLGDYFPEQRKMAALLIDKINNKVNVFENIEEFEEEIVSFGSTQEAGFVPMYSVGIATLSGFDPAKNVLGKDQIAEEDMDFYLFDRSDAAKKFDDFVKRSAQHKDVLAELNKWYPILLNERSN